MTQTLGKLWKILNTSVGEINADHLNDIASSVKDGSEAIFKLAEVFSNKDVKKIPEIKALLDKTGTLFDVLNSPWGKVIEASVPFLPLATSLLKICLDITKTEPTLSQSVALITQAAYLESLKSYLDNHRDLKEKLIADNQKPSPLVKGLIKKLDDFELNDYQAKFALVYFPESNLANTFNNILLSRLREIQTGEYDSDSMLIFDYDLDNIVKQIASETPRFIETALSRAKDSLDEITKWYYLGGKEVFEKYLSVDTYLEEKIATLPQQKVFGEDFTFNDIYVPLNAIPLDANGEEKLNSRAFVLQDWVKERILDDKEKDKVIVIQAGPGRGKSVFCRMFADQVRKELHPRITPIFIRLRDIHHFEANFHETLKNALSNVDFVNTDAGWLTDKNTHYLFFLDGFDELSIEGRSKVSLDNFLQQIAQFQKDMTTTETGHRVILTGRTIAFQGLRLPNNLTQVKILTMDENLPDQNLQEEWLGKWQNVVDKDETIAQAKTQAFREFLRADDCPTEVKKDLAVEPLLLYMLGAMHREEKIELGDFQGNSKIQAKITIYEKAFEWVLTKQREKLSQATITGLNAKNFDAVMESILTESALAVVQSGGESAQLKMIQQRLKEQDEKLSDIIDDLKKIEGEKALNTALGAFYIKATENKEGGVEFYHKSFSEFLFAKRLYRSTKEWTKVSNDKYGDNAFVVKNKNLAEQIYDLLGYGGLTVEIVEYLRGLLDKNTDFSREIVVTLFDRLNKFYRQWCKGKFIDAKGTTFPQTKMQELETYISENANLGLRQVDVFTGLNVMILLLELHRYGQSQDNEELNFHPCGEVNEKKQPVDEYLLFRLIGYSRCVETFAFRNIVGRFLYGANLVLANLGGTRLYDANLYGANLVLANLYGANLVSVNLRNASLTGANLYGANLAGTDLRNANLEGADLRNANLKNANLAGADLKNINCDENTNWNSVRGLVKAINVPEELK